MHLVRECGNNLIQLRCKWRRIWEQHDTFGSDGMAKDTGNNLTGLFYMQMAKECRDKLTYPHSKCAYTTS